MSYRVTLRRNVDGKEVVYEQPYEWKEGSDYWWDEGNMGCDCNRWLDFERALGHNPDPGDARCSEGMYTVVEIRLPNGNIVYAEV